MSIATSWGKRILSAAAVFSLATTMVSAQQLAEEGRRKIKFRVNPQYSDLAKRMSLAGKVKIELIVAPDGRVKSARALGGHPVLVQACLDVVKDWKYEPGPEETTEIIEFDFKP